ncbi:MAG: hypothetical protein IPK19_24380 [Chloroflexi bacterium]|nr:hypothetical protein [Chloroflexota bacterium]
MAHIASSEAVLVDILVRLDDATPTSDFDRWVADPDGFDVAAIARRQDLPLNRIVDEYQAYYETAIDLLLHLPDDKLRQQVPVPWGAGLRDAEDLIVGAFYGHKREHAAQIPRLPQRADGHAHPPHHRVPRLVLANLTPAALRLASPLQYGEGIEG